MHGQIFDCACCLAGQHLLSAVCDEVTGADTVSWELHAAAINGQDAGDDVAVDLAIPSVSPEQMQVPAAVSHTPLCGSTAACVLCTTLV
jgi:hypothetical protein